VTRGFENGLGMLKTPAHPVGSMQLTSRLEVIMGQSVTIRGLGFILLLLAFSTLVTPPKAWSQNQTTRPSSAQSQGARSASATPPSDEASGASNVGAVVDTAAMQASKPLSVPVIGAGDLLKVSVLGAPDSDQEVRVSADGNIFLNLVGSVHVAGLTTEEAQGMITKKMVAGGFFTDPQVAVFAKEYVTQGVSVLGEVQKPGVYPLLGERTLFDVLSLAGGMTPKAGKVVSITHRDKPQNPTSVSLSNDPAESGHSNVAIFPGDTVLVSKAGIVYVVGDVHRPSGVPMENGSITVLQAIAMAEGTNPTANLNKAKLIRKTPGGPQEIPLALKDMLASKTPDLRLQAEDIVFVPNSAAKSAGRRTLEAIIQSATGVAIYGAR